MKRWQDWALKATETRQFASLLGAILRFRIEHDKGCAEAERNGVPFTPIWWWWNRDADEYVLTMWDTEAGKDPSPPMYSFGASDPLGTFGQPTKMLVPSNLISQARRLINVRSKV